MYLIIAKYAAIAALVLGVGYLGYDKIYNSAYNKASQEYETKLKEYDDRLKDRINNIELNSYVLLEQYSKGKSQAAKEYKDILAAAKAKPLVVYQNGACEISPDFADAYKKALERANRK